MNVKLSAVVVFSALSIVACGNKYESGVNNAVADNQKATSLAQWEASTNHPDKLFASWVQLYKENPSERAEIAEKVCGALGNLDDVSLTVFEEILKDKENATILKDCASPLKMRLDVYYAAQRRTLMVAANVYRSQSSGNTFRFPENIQKRDLSNGYKAVSGDVAKKEVILTFDDGPSGEYTQSILRSLAEVNAKAIFFALGKNVRANPAVLKQVAAQGHAIGSHSITHSCLGDSAACRRSNGRNLTTDEAAAEIRGGHQAVVDVLGWVDPFFRFPYGESSGALNRFLANNSVGEFYWSIDSEDWKAQTNENMIRKTLEQLDARGRGIILFHDIQRKTAESMPQILRELYNRGYSIVLLQAADPDARFNSKLVRKPLP